MPDKKKDITILAVGDRADFDSYMKFNKERGSFREHGFDYATVSYRRLLKRELPKIANKKVIVVLFFPFSYWDEHIENGKYKGIYGNLVFCRKFIAFWKKADSILRKGLKGKKVLFVNRPSVNGRYRDKMAVKNKLTHTSIHQPLLHRTSSVRYVRKLLDEGENLFLKPRCGSQGKGLTFLSRAKWMTNFIYQKNRIKNRHTDYGWVFRDITDNERFLGQLLKEDILIEKGIKPLVLEGTMIDLRIYVFMGKVMFVYPRRNDPDNIVTNISQGAWGDPSALALLPEHVIDRAKSTAEKAAKALGLAICGIDIMPADNLRDVYVIDINLFPGFPARKKFNLSRKIVEELSDLSGRGRLDF